MKKIFSIALIILMSIQSFYKLGVITYFQLNRQYIAEVLCINKEEPITMCYGQCFLEKNLDLQDDDTPQNNSPAGKVKVEIPIFLITENSYSFTQVLALSGNGTSYLFNYPPADLDTPFHPPAVA